jgi:transcriptional antiterminator
MKPIDRFGLDLSRVRYLAAGPFGSELFLLESTRKVRADNTFSYNATRYEAPRDMRNTTITIRHDPKLLEDFPKNHNLILIGQLSLNTTLQLRHQLDIKSRVTYSVRLKTETTSAVQ